MSVTQIETAAPVPAADLTGTWKIDPAHSRLGFVARHALVTKVRGQFSDFEGTLHLDAVDPGQSSAEVTIQAASVDTRQEQRDGHLRSEDFFAVERYPVLTFRSTAVEAVGDDTYRVTGDLTIRDQTHPVSIDLEYNGTVRDPQGNLRAGFEGFTTVNRKDWGLNWNAALEAGGLLVSEKVTLEFDLAAVKQA
jgi:polyisoprenoid-binding protein YceI